MDCTESLIQHIALPPYLPQGLTEGDEFENDQPLAQFFLESAQEYRELVEHHNQTATGYETLVQLLTDHEKTHSANGVVAACLQPALMKMVAEETHILHISKANAAILLRQDNNMVVTVEAFEVSVKNEDVLAASGRLARTFPGSIVKLDRALFNDSHFTKAFCNRLEKLSTELNGTFAEHSRKAGSTSVEVRQPSNPDLLTGHFMVVLEALGRRISLERLTKRMRDEVNWNDAAIPWRRSPRLQALQLGCHLGLARRHGFDVGFCCYKSFVIFMIAKLCRQAVSSSARNDYLDFIRAKLGRRLHKFTQQHTLCAELATYCRKSLDVVNESLRQRWRVVRKGCARPLPLLPALNIDLHSNLSLKSSHNHLLSTLNEQFQEPTGSFDAEFSETRRKTVSSDGLPVLIMPRRTAFHSVVELADLEAWVKLELESWKESMFERDRKATCRSVAQMIDQYLDQCRLSYSEASVQLSLALLTALELWIALDSLVCKTWPLLKKYHPELPTTVLESGQFLLMNDMQRLAQVERYLKSRHQNTSKKSMFLDPSPDCFEVAFFNRNPALAERKSRIEEKAEKDKSAKRAEWTQKQARVESLLGRSSAATCRYTEQDVRMKRGGYVREKIHDPRCEKCAWKAQADGVTIDIYEHPLPTVEAQSKAVIFDTMCPSEIEDWRSVTWKLAHDFGRAQAHQSRPGCERRQTVESYTGLQGFSRETGKRITLTSTTKSFYNTHYKRSGSYFPRFEEVCKSNGMSFRMIDSKLDQWVRDQSQHPSYDHLLTDEVPTASNYRQLQSCINSTGHTTNETIASRSECPQGLKMTTYCAFRDLRSGIQVQWYNILREMGCSNLDFNTSETSLLIQTAALQASSPSGAEVSDKDMVWRRAHGSVRDPEFCRVLLTQMHDRYEFIAANWREQLTMKTIILLTLRVIDLCPEDEIERLGGQLLCACRESTVQWVRALRGKIQESDKMALKYSQLHLMAALYCRLTFTPIGEDAKPVAMDQLATFLECAAVVQDWTCKQQGSLKIWLRTALIDDWKLSHRLEFHIHNAITNQQLTLTDALKSRLPSDWTLSEWKAAIVPNERWYSAQPIHRMGVSPYVCFNILTGELLVGNEKYGRLPDSYNQGSILTSLFGDRVLEVCIFRGSGGITHVADFQVDGCQIYFGKRHGQLIVRAVKADKTLEFVPSSVFCRNPADPDLPLALIADRCHWLSLTESIVHIRPWSTRWRSSPQDWLLDASTRRCTHRNKLLIDPRSEIAFAVAQSLGDFEDKAHQVLTVTQAENVCDIRVHLPRYALNFTVSASIGMQCVELRAKLIDFDRVGTFIGLKTGIALKRNDDERVLAIIPSGEVVCDIDAHHVTVSVRKDNLDSVKYFVYTVDSVLGCVDTSQGHNALYFKCWLHALTSNVSLDPLTGRTGCEEALRCLSQANARPWMPLSEEAVQTLNLIAGLAPCRRYYPKNLESMQMVLWNERIPPSSQLPLFATLANGILGDSARLEPLSDKPVAEPAQFDTIPHLRIRAEAHSQLYRNPDLRHASPSGPEDVVHAGRHDRKVDEQELRAFEVACVINRWDTAIDLSTTLTTLFQNFDDIIFSESFEIGSMTNDELLGLSFADRWGQMFRYCQKANQSHHKYEMMFMLSTIAYGRGCNMSALKMLIAFAMSGEADGLVPPVWPTTGGGITTTHRYMSYRTGQAPSRERIKANLTASSKRFKPDESQSRPQQVAAKELHAAQVLSKADRLAVTFMSQWPRSEPSVPRTWSNDEHLDVGAALVEIRTTWSSLWANHRLTEHVNRLQQIVDRCGNQPIDRPAENYRFPEADPGLRSSWLSPELTTLLTQTLSLSCQSWSPVKQEHRDLVRASARDNTSNQSLWGLEIICQKLISQAGARRDYGRILLNGIESLKEASLTSVEHDSPMLNDFNVSSDPVGYALQSITTQIEMATGMAWLKQATLMPRVLPMTLLRALATANAVELSGDTKRAIIEFAKCIVEYQWLTRLVVAVKQNKKSRITDEIMNIGTDNFCAETHPDWLLLQIQCDVKIRKVQVEVALEMISPASLSNSSCQLMMGAGKSSVIIPMVATVLADKKRLLRIIVPKPLLRQAGSLLSFRLGGLLGHRLLHLPWSRQTNDHLVGLYRGLHQSTLDSAGVLLALPEHVLSFKLSGRQALSNGSPERAKDLLEMQHFLHENARDVIDECDYTLNVKTQLIYPSGAQSSVDGGKHRWLQIQAVLKLLDRVVRDVKSDFPDSIAIEERLGDRSGFPMIHLLREDVESRLIDCMISKICEPGCAMLPIEGKSTAEVDLIRQCLSGDQSFTMFSSVRHMWADTDQMLMVYLLRGLLSGGVLCSALKKRWNVTYGLYLERCGIAVPYRAKEVPAPAAEFSHADMALILTCLSYYYAGLTAKQAQECLKHVLTQDDPEAIYDYWVNTAPRSVPAHLRSVACINFDDDGVCNGLVSCFANSITFIEYYMNVFVFPKEAKVFEKKLGTSAWDLVLDPSYVECEAVRTTGFSGTNDTKDLMPMSITQREIPSLTTTNAEVLSYMMEDRNTTYVVAQGPNSEKLSVAEFLDLILSQRPFIDVVLDAGAQVLEMDNKSVAAEWLARASISSNSGVEAAMYFNYEDEPIVLYGDGREEAHSSSPFAQDLSNCLVYFDEAHTRGIDLKLGEKARAALTLGLGQSKDSMVQAAMRMRQLSSTQSVVFFAPPEVHKSISDHANKRRSTFSSFEVIGWVIEQTCRSIEQLQPLHVQQGLEYHARAQSMWQRQSSWWSDLDITRQVLDTLEEPERHLLEELYGPATGSRLSRFTDLPQLGPQAAQTQLTKLKKSAARVTQSAANAAMHEEQERELALEVEEERQAERPPRAVALPHKLHPVMKQYVSTGLVPPGNALIELAFENVRETSMARLFRDHNGAQFLASPDFGKTVKRSKLERTDQYQRPVQWVLWSNTSEQAMAISQYEADKLLASIRVSKRVHLIIYAAPTSRKALHFNDLQYFSIPPLPAHWVVPAKIKCEIGLFAGRTHFAWGDLPLVLTAMGKGGHTRDVARNTRTEVSWCNFPVEFVSKWLDMRRDGQDATWSPMGYVLNDKALTEGDSFFRQADLGRSTPFAKEEPDCALRRIRPQAGGS